MQLYSLDKKGIVGGVRVLDGCVTLGGDVKVPLSETNPPRVEGKRVYSAALQQRGDGFVFSRPSQYRSQEKHGCDALVLVPRMRVTAVQRMEGNAEVIMQGSNNDGTVDVLVRLHQKNGRQDTILIRGVEGNVLLWMEDRPACRWQH